METESKISAAMEDKVHIECMSTTSGSQPTFSLSGTMYDTQEVQSEEEKSSKEVCSSEKVITGVSSQPGSQEGSSEDKISPSAVMEGMQLGSDVDIFESSAFNIMEKKYVEVSNLETKYIKLASDSEFIESSKAEISDIPSVIKEKDLRFISPSEEKVAEVLEFHQLTEQPLLQTEIVDTVSVQSSIIKDDSSAISSDTAEKSRFQSVIKDDIQHETKEIYEDQETVDFKGGLSTESIKKETEINLIDTMVVSSDKKLQVTEQVGFKMVSEDVDFISDKIKEKTCIETEKERVGFQGQFDVYDENCKSGTSEVSSEAKYHLTPKDEKKKEIFHGEVDSSETVDFKGSVMIGEDSSRQVKEFSAVTSEKSDSKLIEQKKSTYSSDSTEKVDFKGDGIGVKGPVEIVDFKGQLPVHLSEQKKESTIMEVKSEFTEELGTSIKEIKLEKVDMQSKVEDPSKYVPKKDIKFSRMESDTVLEIVDFKGLLGTDKLNIQQEKDTIQSDAVTLKDIVKPEGKTEVIQVDQSADTIDFKGVVYSSYSETEKQEKEFDITRKSIDDNQNLYSDNIVYDTHTAEMYKYGAIHEVIPYDPRETYGYGVDELAITSTSQETYGYGGDELAVTSTSQETYGFGVDEQALTFISPETYGYGADEQAIAFVSQQQMYHDGVMISDSVNYAISAEESSELYSCGETLSTADDTTQQFYSISDDLEDSINATTSEEFTDVPSHLTESSDKWSDVEGDFSFEDADFDRDKTPTRADDDIMITGKETFKEVAVDIQMCESEIKSKSVEKQDDKIISLDSKESTMIASEMGVSDLNGIKHTEPDLQKFETLSNLRDVETESRTFVLEEIKEAEAILELGTSKILKHPAEDVVSEESLKQIDIIEPISEKITETAVSSHDEFLDTEASNISLKLETELFESPETESIYEEISSTDSAVLLQSTEDVELLSGEESIDVSVITASEDYTDVASTEVSEKWSEVENDVENLEKESVISTKIIPEDVSDQGISVDSLKVLKDIQLERDDTETPLIEHFADVKSLKDQLTTVDTFSLLDAETAVSITHEDTSTDISSQFEKTESEHWLEAETEHSISEVGEDIAFCIEKDGDTKVIVVEYEKTVEEIDTAIQSSETPYASTTSTSSSYSDLENSDQTSDTCADISLQGATTENSDKWSDIEAEGLIDDVLYGNVDITETMELTDFPQLIKKSEESKDIVKAPLSEDQLKIEQDSSKTSIEVGALSAVEVKSKSKEIQASTESKSDLLKTSKASGSFEGPESTFTNLTDSGQSYVPTESSSSFSAIPSATGISDDEFTNVTPLDTTTEESDKWSDISGDASLEEIDDESSVSLKASLKLQDQESDAISSEFKVGLRKVAESKSIDVKFKVPKVEDSVSLKSDLKLQGTESEEVTSEFKVDISKKELGSTVTEDSEKYQLKLKASKIDDSVEETATYTSAIDKKEEKFYIKQDSSDNKLSMKTKDIKESSQFSDSFTAESKSFGTLAEQASVPKVLSDEESFDSFKQNLKIQDEVSDSVTSEFMHSSLKKEPKSLVTEESDFKLKSMSADEIEPVTVKEAIDSKISEPVLIKSKEALKSYVEEQTEIEDSSSSKITDQSETLDNFTDVPTHTLTSETSDMYCELDSDHSFEEIESPQVEAEQDILLTPDIISQDVQQTDNIISQTVSEYYENSLANEELLENVDNFALDDIPENELEHYELEEEEYSLSEHFEINEDELIYPLPYNDDWIEQSFELKEYGVEAVFSESGSDIHGLGIANEEYDDEDIQRAIDYNLSAFEDNEDNVENAGATESFKTLSNDTSPHIKQEEFETWSTADAPSIEEEFDEQDNVLSKIDELLAEDFDLGLYQTESPLKHEDYLIRDVSTPDETYYKDITQIDNSSLPKDTLLHIDKSHEVADSKAVSDDIISKKDSEAFKIEFDVQSTEITVKKDSEALKMEMVSAEIEDDSTQALKEESATVSSKITIEEDSKQVLKTVSKSVSDEIAIKKDSVEALKIETEMLSCEIKEDSTQVLKRDSAIVSSKVIIEEDSKKALKTVSDEKAVKKDSMALKTETEMMSGEIKDNTTQVLKKECATVSSSITVGEDSEKVLKTVTEHVSGEITVEKDLESTLKREYDSSTKRESAFLSKPTEKIPEESKVSDINEVSSTQSHTLAVISKTSMPEQIEISAVVGDERIAVKGKAEEIISLSEDAISSSPPSDEINKIIEAVQPIRDKQGSSIEADTSFKVKSSSDKKSVVDQSRDFISTSEDSSTSVFVASSDSSKQNKDQLSDNTALSITETDSSFDIPVKTMAKSTEAHEKLLIKTKASTESSEDTEFIQSSQQLSDSLKHSITSAAESIEVQSNIPNQRAHKDETYSEIEQSVSLAHTTSKEQTSADSCVVEVKPDIPKKTKRRSLDSKEGTPIKDESDKKPSLPPKKSKRHSLSDSQSSSFGESLSSSSSVESIGSFESAVSDKSRKSSLKLSDETSMHSLSPEVPSRRSRTSKMSSSSSRSTSRDSDNSSSTPSRSSSLKIRRRSSNFIEPEPIDFSNMKRRASIDERMRKLQAEGKCVTKEKAFIAAKLLEMQFEEEDALLASRQCNTVYHAVKFLTQLCEMCNCRFPINLMSSMVHCAHRACRECLKAHFTSLIYDRSVFTLLCPLCQTSDITDQNIQEYFTHLEMNLRNILDEKVYDLFQRKLRDEVLTKDPNFHWCSQCSSGFIASPRLKKLYCPDCSAITCAMCHQTWELEHEGVHCERFQEWKDMHTPEPPPAGLVKYLVDRGISCPSCGLVYPQACGGCMMYKCSHCSFEFCGFCIQPVKRGRECSNEICDSRGLHIHHLHNCLFFLRDKDITEIQILLEEESITYLTIPPKDQIVKSRCQVREQKNNHGILTEDRCGRDIEPYCGGLCRTHYYEYLAELLRKNNISPLSIMTIQDLQFMLRKSRVLVPEKVKGEKSEDYYERLLNLVTSTLT